eukprot:352427-Chlamydomonas_euryale.AAC.5
MATPTACRAPTLEYAGGDTAPKVIDAPPRAAAGAPATLPSAALPAAGGGNAALQPSSRSSDGGGGSGSRAGRTRVFGPAALAKRGAPPRGAVRNTFAAVAPRWAAALLRGADGERACKEPLLLGRVLATLGSFSEHAAGSPQAAQLAGATMELLRSYQARACRQGGASRCGGCMVWLHSVGTQCGMSGEGAARCGPANKGGLQCVA